MVEVMGKPMLEHHVEWLKGFGVSEIFINLYYRGQVIRDYFGDGSRHGVQIEYFDEPELRGTAGALRGFREHLTEPFLLHYGDVYSTMDVNRFHRWHEERGAEATLVVHPSSHPEDSDIVQIGPDSKIRALHHKPGHTGFGNLGNAACYLLEPNVLAYIHEGPGEQDFIKDVFPGMLADGRPLYGYDTDELLLDMGTPDRYRRLMETLKP